MTSRRFILHGISGVYNYGCEAIVRGTVQILRGVWPDCRVIYLSERPREAADALDGCDVEIHDNAMPAQWHPRRALKGILRRLGFPQSWLLRDSLDFLREGDCVLSIGGDVFTLGPPPYPRAVAVEAIDRARRIMARGCHFVLWGASVGPFDAWPQSIPLYQSFLKDVDLIAVREPETYRYLAKVGISDNVVAVSDPAFLLSGSATEGDTVFVKGGNPIVGVNLSPLATWYTHRRHPLGGPSDEQLAFVRRLLDDLGTQVVLIPHVVDPRRVVDDDYRFLMTIFNALEAQYQGRIALIRPGLGARRTKGIVGQCDVLVAARMHCAIAGLSSMVPTLLVAYSSKSRGMSEYVYGTQKWCLHLRDLGSTDGLARVRELLAEAQTLRRHLVYIAPHLRAKALRAGDELAKRVAEWSAGS